ncbi:MAG TPA: DUF2007 domain-containing protein [Candidatus Binatia bacterium]|jgi:hypothetical protein
MLDLYSPKNEIEVALLKGLFDSEGIAYFVRNDNFGSLEVGPAIRSFNAKSILVDEKDFDRAKELLTDFLAHGSVEAHDAGYSLFDKIRLALEAVLFGWIMPGRSHKRR